MLIISQDQEMIVNMDNVVGIALTDRGKEISCYYSFLDDIEQREPWREILGKYSTPERAKAVLQELANAHDSVFQIPVDNIRPKKCEECEGACPYASLEDKYKPRNCDFYYSTIPF